MFFDLVWSWDGRIWWGTKSFTHRDESGLTRCGQGCRDERNARQVYGGRSEDKKYHLFLAHLPLWHISLARNPPMPKSMFVLDFLGDHRWKWLGSNIIKSVSFRKSCPLHISNEWLLGILESKAGQNKSNQDGSDAMNLLIYLCMQPKMGTKDASTRNESHSRSLTVLFLCFFCDLFEMPNIGLSQMVWTRTVSAACRCTSDVTRVYLPSISREQELAMQRRLEVNQICSLDPKPDRSRMEIWPDDRSHKAVFKLRAPET